MRWLFLLPASVMMTALALLLAPILPAFASGSGWLPIWLWWFQTPDNPIDGDMGFKTEHAPFKGASQGWRCYINRVIWLWRNPSYGFDWSVLAYWPNVGEATTVTGTRPLSGDLRHSGWFFARCGGAWQFYLTHHWSDTHTTKINLGWKLWNLPPFKFVFSVVGIWKKI